MMMFHPRALRTTILATGFAALTALALGDPACAGGNLDASYTVWFGRIRVGEMSPQLLSWVTRNTPFLHMAALAVS